MAMGPATQPSQATTRGNASTPAPTTALQRRGVKHGQRVRRAEKPRQSLPSKGGCQPTSCHRALAPKDVDASGHSRTGLVVGKPCIGMLMVRSWLHTKRWRFWVVGRRVSSTVLSTRAGNAGGGITPSGCLQIGVRGGGVGVRASVQQLAVAPCDRSTCPPDQPVPACAHVSSQGVNTLPTLPTSAIVLPPFTEVLKLGLLCV
jgi:hypothetical protein